jgi:hypothetical protein
MPSLAFRHSLKIYIVHFCLKLLISGFICEYIVCETRRWVEVTPKMPAGQHCSPTDTSSGAASWFLTKTGKSPTPNYLANRIQTGRQRLPAQVCNRESQLHCGGSSCVFPVALSPVKPTGLQPALLALAQQYVNPENTFSASTMESCRYW